MCCLSFLDIRLLITPLISSILAIVLSVPLRSTTSDYQFGIIKLCHCVVCPSFYGFWLPPLLSSILAIVLSVPLRSTTSDYQFGIIKLCHCVVCPSFYGFWLPPFVIFNLSLYANILTITFQLSKYFKYNLLFYIAGIVFFREIHHPNECCLFRNIQ